MTNRGCGRLVGWAGLLLAVEFGKPLALHAFPPYRSTDAETAEPWTLETRLGLVRIEREAGVNGYVSPLLRLNFGFPHNVELVSELEYAPTDGRLGDAAVGTKWIPLVRSTSIGIETLALLPVSREGGVGTEVSLLATVRNGPLRLHLNTGWFYDARPDPVEKGWRAGALTEIHFGRYRPGLELFGKQVVDEPVQVQLDPGIIVALGPVDVRTALRFGLTPEAPDLAMTLWVTGNVSLLHRERLGPRGG